MSPSRTARAAGLNYKSALTALKGRPSRQRREHFPSADVWKLIAPPVAIDGHYPYSPPPVPQTSDGRPGLPLGVVHAFSVHEPMLIRVARTGARNMLRSSTQPY